MQSALQYGLTLAVAIGCAGKTAPAGDNCPAGNESCLCYGNGSCNDGLECQSNRCVFLGTGGNANTTGATSLGGAIGTGGSPGAGGRVYLAGGAMHSGGTPSAGGNPAGGVVFIDAGSGGSRPILDPNYCNGLLSGQVCGQTTLLAGVQAANMLLVIDESGSMLSPASSTSTANKWSELNQALASVLPSFENDINFGLELFPYDPNGIDATSPSSSCNVAAGNPNIAVNVDIAPGAANLAAITDVALNQTPAGGTPTSKALQQAYAYFTQGNGKYLEGTRSIVLVTDGGPNCNGVLQCTAGTCTQNLDGRCGPGLGTTLNCCDTSTASGAAAQANLSCLDDVSTIAQIENLKAAGVATYVIGLPGSEPYAATLNSMANAGGVPNPAGTSSQSYYAVSASNSLQDLKTALSGILTSLVTSCDIWLNSTPTSASTVQVVKDCGLVPQLPGNKPPPPDGGVLDGFYIDYSQSPAHLIFTGTYCSSPALVGASRLDVIEGCTIPN